VAADIEEGAQYAFLVADEHDRDLAYVRRPVRARLGDLVGAADVLPETPEDALVLQPEHGGVRVPAPRERPRADRAHPSKA